MNYSQLIIKISNQLSSTIPEHARQQEADWLMCKVTNMSKEQLLAKREIILTDDQSAELEKFIEQRTVQNKPIGYILGNVPFCGLEIATKEPILIPRMETEEIVEELLADIGNQENARKKDSRENINFTPFERGSAAWPTGGCASNLNILDLCTGSGCIALALAKHLPGAKVVGTDIDPQAVELAIKNTQKLGISNASFLKSDLFNNIDNNKEFDLIISNPPYLSEDEWHVLDPQVKDWETKTALVGQNNGLGFYEQITEQSKQYLTNKNGLGWLVFEIGHAQKDAVTSILKSNGFNVFKFFTDSFGKDRAIFSKIS